MLLLDYKKLSIKLLEKPIIDLLITSKRHAPFFYLLKLSKMEGRDNRP